MATDNNLAVESLARLGAKGLASEDRGKLFGLEQRTRGEQSRREGFLLNMRGLVKAFREYTVVLPVMVYRMAKDQKQHGDFLYRVYHDWDTEQDTPQPNLSKRDRVTSVGRGIAHGAVQAASVVGAVGVVEVLSSTSLPEAALIAGAAAFTADVGLHLLNVGVSRHIESALKSFEWTEKAKRIVNSPTINADAATRQTLEELILRGQPGHGELLDERAVPPRPRQRQLGGEPIMRRPPTVLSGADVAGAASAEERGTGEGVDIVNIFDNIQQS